MKIGILGAGMVGQSLARAVIAHGHTVMLSSRTPDSADIQKVIVELGANAQAGTVSQTIAYGDMIAVALRFDAIADVAKQGDWSGKIVMDMSNRFGGTTPSAVEVAKMLAGAHVVKAFNTIGAEHYSDANFGGQPTSMFIAGDDANAKKIVTDLITQLGFEVVNVGGLADSHHLDALASLWVHLAMRGGMGRNIALRLIHK
ncbi:MAG TPA: NAD(P)-binding domain-containing protein [Aggregatilineales bacterium]|nr:NAD(P)-binding domain-containing protein [Aggregatilineales bacterium]